MRKNSHLWRDGDGKLYARYTFTDSAGKRRDLKRRADSITDAKEKYKAMEREHKEQGPKSLDSARMTFNDLADHAKEHYIKPPVYVDGVKVSGMRSWDDSRRKLNVLCLYFGKQRIREITHDDLKAFRELRIKALTKRNKPRKMASVHRELSLMRMVLNIARRQRWLPYNPFDGGKLISNSVENKRDRVISKDEELRLLAACDDAHRAHLRPIIICGLDTGMRSGEMLKLRWRDVDFATRRISIIAFNTKTAQSRPVPMTTRLTRELERLWRHSRKDTSALVFGITHRIKRSWATACQIAEIHDATPHDLRHTAATRMVQKGMALAEVSRILGHASAGTTYRYVNPTPDTLQRAADLLDEFNEEH